MKSLSGVLIIVFLFASCDKKDEIQIPTSTLDQEFYQIIETMLMPLSSINMILGETDTTMNCSYFNMENADSMDISQDIIDECIRLNKKIKTLNSNYFSSSVHKLITKTDLEELTWQELQEKYGASGLFTFGAPVFYDNGNKAIFEMSYLCGPLCGSGDIKIMQKENNFWHEIYNQTTWVSK